MTVLVDTPVWSLAYRRKRISGEQGAVVDELKRLISNGSAVMIGPVRQELLSSIRDPRTHELLRVALRAFDDLDLITEDFEYASSIMNRCQTKGIQGSSTDFLLCAVAARYDVAIYSADRDFDHFSRILQIRTHHTTKL
jgi:predicted nucleic acid-binding protein